MDVDAIIARHPEVVLGGVFTQYKMPGRERKALCKTSKMFSPRGITVISTLNVQHLESLYGTVKR